MFEIETASIAPSFPSYLQFYYHSCDAVKNSVYETKQILDAQIASFQIFFSEWPLNVGYHAHG
jgi:hypothetical protein